MNYLVHLYLSDPEPETLLGNLVGDFVKGPLPENLPPAFRRGLVQHRRLDSFAHTHPAFGASRRRIDPRFGHGRPVMVDIFYDHLLAADWPRFHPLPLAEYAASIYRLAETHRNLLPPAFLPVLARMATRDWLTSYRDPLVLDTVLARIATRLSRPLPLAEGRAELEGQREAFRQDCHQFLAEAGQFLRKIDKPGP